MTLALGQPRAKVACGIVCGRIWWSVVKLRVEVFAFIGNAYSTNPTLVSERQEALLLRLIPVARFLLVGLRVLGALLRRNPVSRVTLVPIILT